MLAAKFRIAALIFCLCSSIYVFSQSGAISATVTGEGTSYWDARQDCVRQALQQSLSQLVIVDRRIEDDKVIRDSIASTMNGFVDSFRVLSQSKLNNRVRITADVRVSESGITNFVLSGGKGTAQVDSSTLLGELARDDLARRSRSDILKRLLDGFPLHAFDAKITKVSLDPSSRGAVLATVQMSVSKGFVKALKAGLKTISRPGGDDGHTPDSLSLCLDSRIDDSQQWVGEGDCRTASVDFAGLNQQRITGDGQVYFLVWFSGSIPSPMIVSSEYWRISPYNPSGFLKIRGANELFSSSMYKSAGRSYGSIQISGAVRTYAIRIPKDRVPDGSGEIHILPIVVDNSMNPRMVVSLFDPAIPLDGTDFKQLVTQVLQDTY